MTDPKRFVVLLTAAIIVSSGCSVTPKGPYPESSQDSAKLNEFNSKIALLAGQATGEGEYLIGEEDLLEVTLFDIQDKNGLPRIIQARVSTSGHVTLPYVGKIKALGATPHDFEEHLTSEFMRFIREPQITVFVREYRSYQISVVGYVENPGIYELKGRRTLLEGLAMAGGLNEDAGRKVRLTRQLESEVETILLDLERIAREGDLSLNLALLPGDVISVPQAGVFYVEGMVTKPGAYPLQQPTTVSQALATAGGMDFTLANVSGTVLLRKMDNGEREQIPVRYAAIKNGKAEDFMIEEDDVIVVPLSGTKFIFDRTIDLFRVNTAI